MPDTTFGNPAETFGPDIPQPPTTEGVRRPTRAGDPLRSVADRLPGGERVRDIANDAADRLDDTVDYLRDREPREILDDLRAQAKANPVPFIVTALAFGFVVGRLLRR